MTTRHGPTPLFSTLTLRRFVPFCASCGERAASKEEVAYQCESSHFSIYVAVGDAVYFQQLLYIRMPSMFNSSMSTSCPWTLLAGLVAYTSLSQKGPSCLPLLMVYCGTLYVTASTALAQLRAEAQNPSVGLSVTASARL